MSYFKRTACIEDIDLKKNVVYCTLEPSPPKKLAVEITDIKDKVFDDGEIKEGAKFSMEIYRGKILFSRL